MAYPTPSPYQPQFPVRIVTAASLFDGHDAAINIMRRVIQGTGCEVIHLGHDKSAEEVVTVLFKKMQTLLHLRLIKAVTMNILNTSMIYFVRRTLLKSKFLVEVVE